MDHLTESWFQRSQEAANKGKGNIYAFHSLALRERYKQYYEQNYHTLEAYNRYFLPNPFTFQYDLLVYCWVHFRQILNEEITLLRKKGDDDQADELQSTNTLYGIHRSDFLFGAVELRWPSRLMGEAYRGPMVRDPWMEKRTKAFSDERYKYIISFGGGGQGKTLTFIALCLIIWDHYIFTQKGARCMISTTSKDKLDSAAWSYLQQLISSTERDVSLYAGRGIAAGDHTIKRPNNKDIAGVFKGILLAPRVDDSSVVDKLTGAHGHPFVCYIMDEMQSTTEAPIKASGNYTMQAGDFRVIGAGNYSEDTDTLGQNCKPTTGWESVSPETGEWMSYMVNHQPALVLHFSNDQSPGMDPENAKRFPYLPNRQMLQTRYPKAVSRTIDNQSFRRFWLGWRIINAESNTVLVKSTVEATGCDQPVQMSSVLHRFFSFDSAQGEGDRNILGSFVDGIDANIGERVFGIDDLDEKLKSSDALKYYQECAEWIINKAKLKGINSGAMILDWTGRPAHAEIMNDAGFQSVQFIYHQGVPDGKRKDPKTGRVNRAILVNPDPQNRLYAHQVATDQISLAAWFLQNYVQAGRVRGMNEGMMEWLSDHHGIDEEMYSRKFRTKISQIYGEMYALVSKKEFKNQYGFSPDLMDIWLQAAYYMFTVRHFPLSPISSHGKETNYPEREMEEEHEELCALYADDMLPS